MKRDIDVFAAGDYNGGKDDVFEREANMAVVKRFFFDGEEIREEVTEKTAKKLEKKMADKPKSPTEKGEVRMLVSSLLKKDGKCYARVSFLRGDDIAEGIVPDGTLEHISGFSEEEAAGLKFYLAANKEVILAQARQIDPLTNWLRKSSLSQ